MRISLTMREVLRRRWPLSTSVPAISPSAAVETSVSSPLRSVPVVLPSMGPVAVRRGQDNPVHASQRHLKPKDPERSAPLLSTRKTRLGVAEDLSDCHAISSTGCESEPWFQYCWPARKRSHSPDPQSGVRCHFLGERHRPDDSAELRARFRNSLSPETQPPPAFLSAPWFFPCPPPGRGLLGVAKVEPRGWGSPAEKSGTRKRRGTKPPRNPPPPPPPRPPPPRHD